MFVPHNTMKRLWTISSGSMPVPMPIVEVRPAEATAPQMLRSRPLQPIDPNSRRSSECIWMSPCTPAELCGRIASAPDSATIGLPARGDVGQRVLPAHALEARVAFRPDAFQRMQHAIGVIDALQVVIHLRAERAARERMRRIAAERPGVAVATSTTQPQVSGQSCPQAPRTIADELAEAVMIYRL